MAFEDNESGRRFTYASRRGSGMLFSTFWRSLAPKPVTVRLCLGRLKSAGPTGPLSSEIGALEEGLRSRIAVAMMVGRSGACELELVRGKAAATRVNWRAGARDDLVHDQSQTRSVQSPSRWRINGFKRNHSEGMSKGGGLARRA
jgi:hypothetical protein